MPFQTVGSWKQEQCFGTSYSVSLTLQLMLYKDVLGEWMNQLTNEQSLSLHKELESPEQIHPSLLTPFWRKCFLFIFLLFFFFLTALSIKPSKDLSPSASPAQKFDFIKCSFRRSKYFRTVYDLCSFAPDLFFWKRR